MIRRLDNLERVTVGSAEDLREWLEAHCRNHESVWLVSGRKGSPGYIAYDAIVCVLLAYGWIDSLPRALDAAQTMLMISPRKPGSNWSKDNRARIARLEQEGQMHPAGAAVVEAARRDGSWDRLRETEDGTPPTDLAQALAAGRARSGWDGLSLSVRRRALESLLAAKRPETRTKRIARIVAASAQGADPTAWQAGG
jgi:uncharacterized protein YdeI (YjbR/CyaY-like superfamily)